MKQVVLGDDLMGLMVADILKCPVISTGHKCMFTGPQFIEDYITSDSMPGYFKEYNSYLRPIDIIEGYSINGKLVRNNEFSNLKNIEKWHKSKSLYSGSGLSGLRGLYTALRSKLSDKIVNGSIIIRDGALYINGDVVKSDVIVTVNPQSFSEIAGIKHKITFVNFCYHVMTGFDTEGYSLIKIVDQGSKFFDAINISKYDMLLRSDREIQNIGMILLGMLKSYDLIGVTEHYHIDCSGFKSNILDGRDGFKFIFPDNYGEYYSSRILDDLISADRIIHAIKAL